MVVKTIKGGVACIFLAGADLYNKAAHKLLQNGGMATIICKTEADKKKATKDISNKLEQIKKLTAECVMLADENGLDFSLDTPRDILFLMYLRVTLIIMKDIMEITGIHLQMVAKRLI